MSLTRDEGYRVLVLCCVVVGEACFGQSRALAGPAERLIIHADTEHTYSDFQRDPKPPRSETGSNFSQEYKFDVEGGMMKYGRLDSSVGVLLSDLYRKGETDLNQRTRVDYGRWLRLETLTRNETDREILFSGTAEPQSPIHTVTNRHNGRLAVNKVTSVEYTYETKERKDLLIGSLVGENTESHRARVDVDSNPVRMHGEYGRRRFKDLTGTRSDIDSQNSGVEAFYKRGDKFSASQFIEVRDDTDLNAHTSLGTKDARFEMGFKPVQEIKVRDRVNLRNDNDTRTDEDIDRASNEIILNVDPSRVVGVELAYKRAEEDKTRVLTEIDSTTDEKKARARFVPYSRVTVEGGYQDSDKSSSAASENLKDTTLFSDFSFQPTPELRLGTNLSNTERKNTFTSVVDSDSTSFSTSAQYRPKRWLALFTQLYSSKTKNPSTNTLSQTDTLSSNLSMDLTSFMGVSLRTSAQEVSGSSVTDTSERLLNSVEMDLRLSQRFKVIVEYEWIDSSGLSATDEGLFDVSLFYTMDKFDLSLRLQQREVQGDNLSDKTAILSSLKYRFSANAVWSFQFYYTDYSDKTHLANSYDTTSFESRLSMRF